MTMAQEDEVIKNIEMMRARMEALWESMTVEDFKRVHAKFFGCIISIEQGFKKRFPAEWIDYGREFYGEEDV